MFSYPHSKLFKPIRHVSKLPSNDIYEQINIDAKLIICYANLFDYILTVNLLV